MRAWACRAAAGFVLALLGTGAAEAGDGWGAAFIFGLLGVAVGLEAGKARKGSAA